MNAKGLLLLFLITKVQSIIGCWRRKAEEVAFIAEKKAGNEKEHC
ncbi:hypothetical protein [Odoribacter lunatus]|nr:hypothetical protein [Odoribacter lunatus]